MAEAISDKAVVNVLRPFVRATGPMLDALRDSDPVGLLARAERRDRAGGATTGTTAEASSGTAAGGESADALDRAELEAVEPGLRDKLLDGLTSVKVPGTEAWAAMSVEQRTDWWVNRVGRFTALITAIPGLGGALADRLPVQDALGASAQGLLLCAIAGEHGVTDLGERVRLVAWVLFERDVDPDIAAGRHAEHDAAAEDTETEELTEELSESSRKHGKATLKACAKTLWRLGRSLLSITDELEKRPSGRFYHHAIGMLPVVGMVGDYFGERSGLKRVAKRARKWLAAHPA
ncbi:hypothetical protein CFN78_09165 [Amycolatopsis antarctica]|uniref:Uncharacterized protein n=1 Tax=Amycolatopsis antarctica TaxID=1854586 RepID=A0A263D658_9PSEU|nr:hypothetical protein [Amycolatopsis antarctica]OZM73679.1 hypothetical protein CFN78_09165 [Amycolatopsis antarctica]